MTFVQYAQNASVPTRHQHSTTEMSALSVLGTSVTGDLLYASAANTWARLADVAAGSFLRSGGVGTAPAWSTATIPNTATAGDVLYASANNVWASLAKPASASVLTHNATVPSWAANLPYINLPTGTGTWDVGSGNTVTFQRATIHTGGANIQGTTRLGSTGGTTLIAVWGAAGASGRPSVTGSRGGNAALASLLTQLATIGWITDSTTV